MKAPSRTLIVVAVGVLLLDALLLAYAGILFHRTGLIVAAAVCTAAAGLMLWAWRRYRRVLVELERDRAAMKREVEEIRDLIRGA